ncbi:MAG TPA: carboxypeptidase-like regulatory domain-containing protein [Thermoanaerobaculia bacterium]
MKTFFYPLLLAAVLLSAAGCAREKVIRGKVTDEQGNALADAVVRIENSSYETRTGSDGSYKLDYTPGKIKLIVARKGYGERELDLTIAEKRPYEAPPAQLEKADDSLYQKQTVSDMRNLGTAMFSWLTDQVGAAAAGQSWKEMDIEDGFVAISRAELEKILVPQYIRAVPRQDGWGNDYELYLNQEDTLAYKVMAIRSPGRDGRYSRGPYKAGSFTPEDYDQDIVWVNGYFLRWPEGLNSRP